MSEPQRRDLEDATIPTRFEQAAGRFPDRPALVSATRRLTYRALNRAANRIAHAVLRQYGDAEEPLALLLDPGAPIICALLGGLKAGKVCIPLDATLPHARLAAILGEAQAHLLITDAAHHPLAEGLLADARATRPPSILDLDALPADLPDADPCLRISARRASAIYYTSGSTGRPKGVVRDHRMQLHTVAYTTRRLRIEPADRLALVVSPSTGMSDQIIFGALLNGASLHILDPRAGGLAAWLHRTRVTVYASTPTLYRELLAGAPGGHAFPDVRVVWLSGETASRDDVTRFHAHFAPGCLLVNALGTVETGDFRHFVLPSDGEFTGLTVPAGYPAPDKEVLLLDPAGRAVPTGAVGEIAVRSAYLARGYWRRPALTAQRFLTDPAGGEARTYLTGDLGRLRADGCLEYLGRADRQVKIRGHRVEPAEVEAALRGCAGIADAAVVAGADAAGEARLIAYVTPAGAAHVDPLALRRTLRRTLPAPMLPAAFVVLDALPRTPTGKVDRAALPPPVTGRRPDLDLPFEPPASELERLVASVWAATLGLATVGRRDDFTDLGGDSLDAMRIVARVGALCGEELSPADLFGSPTVAALAVALLQRRAARVPPAALEQLLAEVAPS